MFAGADTLVVILEDGFTTVERNLLAIREAERLRDTRLFLQRELEHRIGQVVHEAPGRPVRAS